MYSTLLTVALFLATALPGALADFAISTPEFTQCQPAHISWAPSKGPYSMTIVDPKDPCGPAILEAGEFNGTSISWTAAIPAGKTVQVYLEDSGVDEAWSGEITVAPSDDTSCLHVAAVAGNAASSSSSTPSVTPLVAKPAAATPSPSVSVAPVGAANAGTDPFGSNNGAPALRQVSTPFMVLSALAAAVVLSL